MIKKILSILVALIFTGYMVFSILFMSEGDNDRICQGVGIHIKDSLDISIVNSDIICDLLESGNLQPQGKLLDAIDTKSMEDLLLTHPLIAAAECYKTSGGEVKIIVRSKVPMVRVMNNRGEDYYVDSRGELLTHRMLSVHLLVATGYIERSFASKELLDVVNAINKSDFWKAQIVQINVNRDRHIELVPRVGNHLLILGSADDLENKLDRLFNFYGKGLDKIGWNKYRSVSVAYANQIVCKKR